jgi:hypothetical protein
MHPILRALRTPEAFALESAETAPPTVHAALALTASLGVGLYGLAMHLPQGLAAAAEGGVAAILAAGVAWSATLPSLYVIGSLNGSALSLRAVALATLLAVSFGGFAMIASIPVLWFFELCLPYVGVRLFINLIIFAGVGLSMLEVFRRVMTALEGPRAFHFLWMGLLSLLGAEMFALFGLFNLGEV